MLSKILKVLFEKKKEDHIDVKNECSEPLLMVRLFVNERLCAWMQCVIQSETTILIGDIWHHNENRDYNRGYGSLMMENLLAYAKEHNFSYIYGNLSKVDLDHKERLHHFYRKFGFAVTEYPERQGNYYGIIELHL